MDLLNIASIVFFISFGIGHFYPVKYSRPVCALSALVIGILMLVK